MVGVQMALARGIDILVARKHPSDDGVFADLTNKQRMPIGNELKKIAIHYTQESTKYGTNDLLCLTKAINKQYLDVGAPLPFTFGSGIEGKFYKN